MKACSSQRDRIYVHTGLITNYNMVLTESQPMYPPDVDGWYVKLLAVNGAQGPFRVTAFVICGNVA
jgi:hypothetical protein